MIGGGAPLRYDFTSRAFHALSPWNDATCAYSILQLYKGYNPLSKIEVVSTLNTLSQAVDMYFYNYGAYPAKYALKVYLGTSETIGTNWIYNDEDSWKNTQKMDWPQAFQGGQKGEDYL